MKKLLILVIVIVLAVLSYNYYKGSSNSSYVNTTGGTSENTPSNTTTNTNNNPSVVETKADASLLAKLSNSSISVSEDGSKVNLLNGTATFSSADSGSKSTVSLGTAATKKSFGNRNDIIAVINLSSSGVNTQYLVLFQDLGNSVNQTSIAYLGQGLDVRGIVATDLPNSGQDYVVSVSSLTQKPGVTSTYIIPVKDGAFDAAKAISI